MSASARVDLGIYGQDTDLKTKLDSLKGSLDILKHDAGNIEIKADDRDAQVKLLDMRTKLDALNRKVANPKIKIDGADRALVDIAKIDVAMDDLKHKSDDLGKSSFFGKLGSIFSGLTTTSGWNLSKLFSGEAGESAEGAPSLASPIGIGAIAEVVSMLGAMVPALSGLTLALGGGAGGIYALSRNHPKLFGGVTGGIDDALQRAMKSLTTNQFSEQHVGNNLTGSVAIKGTSVLSGVIKDFDQIGGFIKTLGPGLGKLFAAAIPETMQFAKALEPAVKQMLPLLTKDIQLMSPDIKILGSAFGILLTDATKTLSYMSPAFRDSAIVFKAASIVIGVALEGLGRLFAMFAEAWQMAGHDINIGIQLVERLFDIMRSDVVSAITGAVTTGVNVFERLPSGLRNAASTAIHDVISVLSALPGELYSIGSNAIHSLISGFESAIGSLGSVVSGALSELPGGSAISGILHHLATGGMITEPIIGMGMRSHETYMLGENGPEAVIPTIGASGALNGSGSMAGRYGSSSGDTYILNVSGFVGSERQLATEIHSMLSRYKRQNGNKPLNLD